jgi:DNA-binding transcriptional LysR family regulator
MSNFDQITTFIEVANTLSFAQASRRLSLSTSTVSARVKALETRLNVRLLNRNTRSVTLTDEGKVYFTRCQDTLEQLLDVEDSLSQKAELSGRIKVTIPLNLPTQPFVSILSEFTNTNSHVDIDVLVTDEPMDLITNNIDVAIRGKSPGALSLIAKKLGEGHLKLFSSPQYYESEIKNEKLQSLAKFAVFDPVNALASLPLNTTKTKSQLSTRNFKLAKQFAIQSKGIALLPENLCLKELHSGQLMTINFSHKFPTLPLYIVFPNRQHLPARVRAFIDFLVLSQDKHPLI